MYISNLDVTTFNICYFLRKSGEIRLISLKELQGKFKKVC
ncbi:hypothetical protein BN2127_JRS1_03404 [Bacillus cereus]|nr:hypothetical protein BN2127_JRS1_03404 [Bacillus cereus]